MATTRLFVEVLITGILSVFALFLFWLGLVPDASSLTLDELANMLKEGGAGWLALILVTSYTVGWPMNFLFERAAHYTMRGGSKRRLFEEKNIDYDEAKVMISQYGSASLQEELRFDRHIIRMSRTAAFGCSLLFIGCVLNGWYVASITVLALSVVSFFQCHSRIVAMTKRIRDGRDILLKDMHHVSEDD